MNDGINDHDELDDDPWDPREMEITECLTIVDSDGSEVTFMFLDWWDCKDRHFLQCVEEIEVDEDFDADNPIEFHIIEWEFDDYGRPAFDVLEDPEEVLWISEMFALKRLKKQVVSWPCAIANTGDPGTYVLTRRDAEETFVAVLVTAFTTIDGHDLVIFNAVVPIDDREVTRQVVFRYCDGRTDRYEALDDATLAVIAPKIENFIDAWADAVLTGTVTITVGEC